ncbi:MAG: hypothetical protein Q8Q09_22275 [Deltaproteobacteria bacterium]|nr:hypothetical protein [Deltaproteobacteria bacterium]
MSVTVPSREFRLPTNPTLVASPLVLNVRPWVGHIVKHPLGALESPTQWNAEGFDRLDPPVVKASERDAFVTFVQDSNARGGACGVPSICDPVSGEAQLEQPLPCFGVCPSVLVLGCRQQLSALSDRYAALVDELLASVSDGVVVPRAKAFAAIARAATPAGTLDGLAVLAVGVRINSSYTDVVAKVSRADGVRVDFYVRSRTLRWRTTMRRIPRSPTAAARQLLDVPRDDSMSATVLVARSWWQQQQVPNR